MVLQRPTPLTRFSLTLLLLSLPACARFVAGHASDGDARPADAPRSELTAHDGSADGGGGDDASRDAGRRDIPPVDAEPDQSSDVGAPDQLMPDHLLVDLAASADLPLGPDALTTLVTVDKKHDGCQTAFEIDLSIAPGGAVEFLIDTSGAAQDFSLNACGAWPDVVVRLRNATGARGISCSSGGGSFAYAEFSSSGCTQLGKTTVSSNCLGGTVQVPHPASDYLLVFCRDPTLAPARIRVVTSGTP